MDYYSNKIKLKNILQKLKLRPLGKLMKFFASWKKKRSYLS